MGDSGKTKLLGALEQVCQIFEQPALVLLHRQQVVGFLFHNLLSNLLLAAHGVNGHDTALQLQQLQQPRDGG